MAHAVDVDDRRRAIADAIGAGRRFRFPDFFAGVFVECDDVRAIATRERDEFLAVDQRVCGITPERRAVLVRRLQIFLPNDFTLSIEANEVTFGTERIDFAAVNERGATRAVRVAHRILDGVFVLPDLVAVGFVEAEDAFEAGEFLAIRVPFGHLIFRQVIHDENLALGHGRAAIRTGDFRSPNDLRPALRELLENPRFLPHVIAGRPHPLRPVVRTPRHRRGGQHRKSRHPYEHGLLQ